MSKKPTLRNLTPLFYWLFVLVWLSLLTTSTYIYIRNKGVPGIKEPWGIILFIIFWLFGLGFTKWAFNQPCTKVSFVNGRLLVDQKYPFNSTLHYLTNKEVRLNEIITGEDSDGNPYYKLKLEFGPEKIIVAEGHSKDWVHSQRDKLVKALEES